MNEIRIGRSEERGEASSRKKSKSRDRGSDGVDEFDMQTADRIFGDISTKVGFNFKGAFDNAVPVVQALLLDEYSRERLNYLQDKAEFEERQRKFQVINAAFTELQAPPQSQPSVSVTTTAATSNSAGGIFGMFNSQNFTTNTSANPP